MRSDPVPPRQPLLFQPVEAATPFSFARIVDETRAVWFPGMGVDIEVRFAVTSALASIWFHRMGRDNHVIVFHPILNRPDMPIEVVRFIAKHELTHVLHPAPGHPPCFWEDEPRVGPERFAVWSWLHTNFASPIRRTRWGTSVLRDWRDRTPPRLTPYTPHLAFDDLPWRVLCPEGGAQLRFLPEWAPAPAPLASIRYFASPCSPLPVPS
ncbi:hypothetical protein [Candidatus Amarobacter glycogenicus]|uniref:hypothetical protein n=1 Tax=Candidatus Amarobacter glycogenicus TaxID=3140699 RepID=UPI002A16749F|nr:hypothetical protein [Dehalococcoidia bacterium]